MGERKMKATVRIPKGWKRLQPGAMLYRGDRCLDEMEWEWFETGSAGQVVGSVGCPGPYIRKIKKVRRAHG